MKKRFKSLLLRFAPPSARRKTKAIAQQLVPPVAMPAILGLVGLLKKPFQQDERSPAEVNALKTEFAKRNAHVPADEIALRNDLRLKVHPESRVGFEYFCYHAPEMVEELDAFIGLTRDKQHLLDIGALHGVFALSFAAGSPSKTAVAVDASPLAFARLLYNVHKNRSSNITPVECALSDGPGTLQMHYEFEHAVAAGTEAENGARMEVTKRTGDDLCRELHFAPDVVKIDVEWHEVKIVRGLAQTLEQHLPLVFIEVHPMRISEEKEKLDELLQFFLGRGYAMVSTAGLPVTVGEVMQNRTDQRLIFKPPQAA